jgi:hypothetical protein
VLGSSGEVAVADTFNHRVQIFDRKGNCKRQFGSKGEEAGQFDLPSALASDAHGNLLVLDWTNRLQCSVPRASTSARAMFSGWRPVCARASPGVMVVNWR